MILDKIIEEKKREIKSAQELAPLSKLIKQASSFSPQHRDFKEAVSRKGKLNLIAEIKKASPSKGVLREFFAPVEIAQTFEISGACALSIVTDKKFFQGDIGYLKAIREVVTLPLLCKDFIIDKYQIYQSLCAGADAVLLIARLLSEEQLKQFIRLCSELKLDAVCEVHNEEDLKKVLRADGAIVGINNRDLDSFAEDLQVTKRLIKRIPKGKIVISESAIRTSEDVDYLRGLRVNAVLIGEAFMRSQNIGAKITELMHGQD